MVYSLKNRNGLKNVKQERQQRLIMFFKVDVLKPWPMTLPRP